MALLKLRVRTCNDRNVVAQTVTGYVWRVTDLYGAQWRRRRRDAAHFHLRFQLAFVNVLVCTRQGQPMGSNLTAYGQMLTPLIRVSRTSSAGFKVDGLLLNTMLPDSGQCRWE